MDATEFARKVAPACKQSQVTPYWADVVKLRNSGYTLGQVCEFLKENGVQISIPGLWVYIQRRAEKEERGGITKEAVRTATKTTIGPKVESASEEPIKKGTAQATSNNPLRALSGHRVPGEFNPIPKAEIEIEID